MTGQVKRLADAIEHTLLKAQATPADIERLCGEAVEHGFVAVCVMPVYVKLAAHVLRGTDVKVTTVIGFPLGAHAGLVKAVETRNAVADGADELDMVMQVGHLKAGDYESVRKDIAAVVEAADGRAVKVILETGLLDDSEVEIACRLAEEAEAHFVKTSTGFGPGGATVRHITLMRRVVGERMGVKASGGIRTVEAALAMLQAGANRIGTSSGVVIIQQAKAAN